MTGYSKTQYSNESSFINDSANRREGKESRLSNRSYLKSKSQLWRESRNGASSAIVFKPETKA